MYAPTVQRTFTFEEFLAWDDGSGRSFELRDGVPVPYTEPTANHEDVADDLCEMLADHCKALNLPYIPKRSKQVRVKDNPATGKEESRKADIVVFARDEWQRMKASPSSAAAYIPPPIVIEVVSSNWRDDYDTKLLEYEEMKIPEYWVVDYAGLGGVRFIGKPKQPTLTVYQLVDEEYQPQLFRGDDLIKSDILTDLTITANQVFAAGREQRL